MAMSRSARGRVVHDIRDQRKVAEELQEMKVTLEFSGGAELLVDKVCVIPWTS